jgi:hypothetical protein
MKAGDVFDPVDVRRLNFYPVDSVDARRDTSDGPKRLYAKLHQIAVTADRRKNPWPGYIYASEKYLAVQLGKSESAIRRDSAALRSLGVVRVERPSRTKNNRYYFIWHPDFERANVSGRDSADVSAQERNDGADLSGHERSNVSGRYKEEPRVLTTTEGARRITLPEPQKSRSAGWNGFEEFRAQYPAPKNSMNVESACRAYVGRISGAPSEHGRLMAGLGRYKSSADWQRALSEGNGRFIPSMEKFISEGRYLDYPQAADEADQRDDYRFEDFPAEEIPA